MNMVQDAPYTAYGLDAEVPELRLAAAVDLIQEHVRKQIQMDVAKRHLVLAAYRAGLSASRIAGLLGESRTPIDRMIREAKAAGELAVTSSSGTS